MNIWYNKYFKYTFWALIIADIFFFWTHTCPKFETVFFILTCLALFYLMLKKIEFVVYLPILELIIGSQGHLMDLCLGNFTLSFRTAIFSLAFLAGLIYLFKNKHFDFLKTPYFKIFIAFLILLAWGTILALIYKRPLLNIFLDLNGYLFILILPIFYQIAKDLSPHLGKGGGDKKIFKNLLYLFWGATLFFCFKTILSFYIFSHHFSGVNLTILYEWLRDSRIGEITMVNNNFFRIFLRKLFSPQPRKNQSLPSVPDTITLIFRNYT